MKKIAIIGAGISGLFIANLFMKKLDYEVVIYEKNNSINLEEGYGIQLSVNSVKLLNEIEFDKFENTKKFNPKKITFFSSKDSKKICDLNITDFNSENCQYTTLKRSDLINFLKKNTESLIKYNHNVSSIDKKNQKIQLSFENNEIFKCDYLIVSDGVFSKSRGLIFDNGNQPKYNNTLAIRGKITNSSKIDKENISLFLGSNFHQVIYPVTQNEDLNFIAIMKYELTSEQQKNYSLFKENSFIRKVLENVPKENKEFFDKIKELRIFPVFVSKDFFKTKSDNIHFIGDAFFAFPPSFAQGASQSIEAAYELYKSIENNTEEDFFKNRVIKTKMVYNRSKINQFAFHLSNPINVFFRNIFLKKLVKNKKFLESYLGKIYR